MDAGRCEALAEIAVMNQYQELWWEQSQSDHKILLLLRRNGADPCHQLHYLQMVTEKLAKAYFWRSGTAPPKNHVGLIIFLRSLGGVQQSQQAHLATVFEFKSFANFQSWLKQVSPLAYDLERLAPALSQTGPNPEYPWPHSLPVDNPVRHQFALWQTLLNTGLGRQFIKIIELAVDKFQAYG
jgi:hypothetical protein